MDVVAPLVRPFLPGMKALLVATTESCAQPLVELMRSLGADVKLVSPAAISVSSVVNSGLFVFFPASDGADLPSLADACARLRKSQERLPFVLAIVHDGQQLDALLEAGADDFLHWPAEADFLNRRLELCRSRINRREREIIRAQHLTEAVREAERSEQRFRHLAESSTEILTRCSPGGVRLYVSPACRQILGYEPDELLGSTMLDILHPADVSKLVDALEGLDGGADMTATIIRLQRKEGDYAWLEMICRPVRDPRSGALEEIVTVARDITSLVHIEHDKLENEGQFEAFASRAPVGILKVDVGGNCVFINPRACELLGTKPADVLGQGWMHLIEVQDFAAFSEPSVTKGLDEKGYSWEMAIRRPSGEKAWLAVKASQTRDREGLVTGYVATLLDVTREELARQELLASEDRFRSIVEGISELVCRYLPDGTLTYVNEAYCRTFHTSPEQLIGKNFLPFLPPEDQIVFMQVVASTSPEHPVAKTVHRVVLPDGEVRWQEWYDRGTFDEDGRLLELVATGRDITERRLLEQELAEAGDFLRDVMDAVPDPISVEDDAGTFVMVNRSFSELVGHPRDEIIGRSVASIRPTPREDGPTHWPDLSDEREITMPASDGILRSLSEKRAVLAARKGHRVLVSVMRDVTERKRYEAQLALTERLASLGTLAAGIAHEINNPLSYVIGNLGFATDTLNELKPEDPHCLQLPEVRNALIEALEGARRIAAIVRDVKMFSRADRETLKLCEPTRVVEASLRMVQSNIESRAKIIREIEEVPRILGNEARLAQVIVNLLMNAVQAMPSRPVKENEIVIAIREDKSSVVMEVRDNGEGIPPDKLRHVFDPFFTTKPVGEGMGLGLSICNSIISAHGGRIDVESYVGVGTAFRVVLPAAPKLISRPKKL